MDNFNFYDTQTVDETHLDGMQADTENSHNDTHRVTGITGINLGITLSAHAADVSLGIVAELTVAADARAFSPDGERIVPTDGTLIQMFVDGDENIVSPPTAGNSKIHRVFMVYERAESVSALAPGNITVQTRREDSARLYIRAGAQYVTGGSKIYPAKNADELIVGDIELDFGATEVTAPDIDLSNATRIYRTPGGVASDSPTNFVADYDTEIRAYIDGAAATFDFAKVTPDVLGLGAEVDTQVTPNTTENALAELMNQLQMNTATGTHGSKFLGFKNANQWANGDYAIDSTNTGAAPGSTDDNLGNAVQETIQGLAATAIDACGARRIGMQNDPSGLNWKDGSSMESGSRQNLYDFFGGMAADLASESPAVSGADKIGYPTTGSTDPAWADGVSFQDGSTTTVYGATTKVVTDLSNNGATESLNGAHKIGMNPGSTRRWADNNQLDRSVAGDTPNVPADVADVIYRVQKDLARSDGAEGTGYERIGVDSTDSVESDMYGSGDALSTGQLSVMVDNLRTLVEGMPVRNKANDPGIFTLLSSLFTREKAYITDSTDAESDDLTSGTQSQFNLVFTFNNWDSGTHPKIRIYTNNHVFMVTWNAEWIENRNFQTGMNVIAVVQKWKADDDTVSSVALMVGDCHRAVIDADQLSDESIFQSAALGGVADGELAYPNSGNVALGAGDGQISQYSGLFSASPPAGVTPVPFLVLVRNSNNLSTISNTGFHDDGKKLNWVWTNGIQNPSTGSWGWLATGFKMGQDHDGSGAGSGYNKYGFTFTGHTDGIV